jgi:hypothetical protein
MPCGWGAAGGIESRIANDLIAIKNASAIARQYGGDWRRHMAMITPKRQRRSHCWIAFWAVFVLLLNQQTAVAHVCMDMARTAPSTIVHAHSGAPHVTASTGVGVGAGAETAMACPHDGTPATTATTACMVHCTNSEADSQVAKLPTIPMLPGGDFWPLSVRIETTMVPCCRRVDVTRKADNRRLYEFCTLLI